MFEIPYFVLLVVNEEKEEPGSGLLLLYCVTTDSPVHALYYSVRFNVAVLFFTLFELTERLPNAFMNGSISVSLISFNMTLINKVI